MSESLREQRRQLERDQRRADIVSAASRLFGEKGYDGTQIAEIATAAEVSLASLYSLFEGKEEIRKKVMERLPVGFEFRFRWTTKGDNATLDDLQGDKVELLKAHLEGEYTRKK